MDSKQEGKCCKCELPGIRYIFVAMGFLGFCTIYALRVNLNVAIVAMVNVSSYGDINLDSECPVKDLDPLNDTKYKSEDGVFNWSPNMQAIVLGSFYLGYCISQIPGGRVAEIYGAKKVFGFGVLIGSIFSLFSPQAARWHVYLFIAVRFLEGLSQGVTMPAMHSMLGKWLPESEKGLLSTLVYIGTNIGTVIAMPLSGILSDSKLFGGWPSAFYIFGFFGCLWFLLWMFSVSDSPVRHPWITKKELKYIIDNQSVQQIGSLPPIPWRAILTSIPFWALIITQFGQDYSFYTLLNDLPTFMSTVLHFDIKTNGYLSALPYVFQTAVGTVVGFVTDALIRKRMVSTAFVRKFCNTASCIGSAAGLLGVCFAGCNVNLTIAMFTLSVGLNGFSYCGYLLTHLDLSPEYADNKNTALNWCILAGVFMEGDSEKRTQGIILIKLINQTTHYSRYTGLHEPPPDFPVLDQCTFSELSEGTLMGISNTLSNLTGYIAPAIVGALTQKHQTLAQWRIVFYIVIAILIVTSVVFLEFSTTEKQNWVPTRKYTILEPDEDTYSESNYGTLHLEVSYNDAEVTGVNHSWGKPGS